jgi:hypothetical protein
VVALRTRLEQRNIQSARERIGHFLTLNLAADGQSIELSRSWKTITKLAALRARSLSAKYDPNHMQCSD